MSNTIKSARELISKYDKDDVIKVALGCMTREMAVYNVETVIDAMKAYHAQFHQPQQKEQFSRDEVLDLMRIAIFEYFNNHGKTTDQLLTEYLNSKTKPI